MKTALVTCSYGPDLRRAELLCRSVREYVSPEIEHLLLVPRRDQLSFLPLGNGRTRIITVESLLPWNMWRVPLVRKWWLTSRSLPVRGWIMQQIVKLSVTEATNADVVVFADSDVTFVRPFGPSHVIKDGLVRLHRLPGMGNGPKHRLWNRKAADLLGIPPRDYFGYDYIGQLVTWKRQNLLGLHRRLEEIGKRGWQRILCGTLHFAEYILYGVFVDQVLGESSGHYHDEADLCHCSWHRTITTEPELTRFFNEIQEQHVAVLVQSYLPFGLDRVRELTERASGGR